MTRPWLSLTFFSNIPRKFEFYINCKASQSSNRTTRCPSPLHYRSVCRPGIYRLRKVAVKAQISTPRLLYSSV